MFYLMLTFSALLLLVGAGLLITTRRKNVDYESELGLGVAKYFSPAIFIPSFYKAELRARIKLADGLLFVGVLCTIASSFWL